ncbi:hypothetical protein [uncultured Prochlorococcus sp.]|uniref:hypothetical protein n=1 Tax=uncultured Prochlorococcus sp. TaxID=159733 RepID=UPI00258DBCE0|nr:hypothetical protein [uncultured Prochlorococcus sp.]
MKFSISILFLKFFLFSPVLAEVKLIENLSLGYSEKGFTFGTSKKIKEKISIGIEASYLDPTFGNYIPAKIDGNPINLSNTSFSIFLKKDFKEKESSSNFFLKGGIIFSRLSIKALKDLTKETYSYNGDLNLKCSYCGDLIINSKKEMKITPSVQIGYKKRISNNLDFNIGGGIQYLSIPSLEWETSTSSPPPIFIRSKIDELVDDLNSSAKEFNKFIPNLFLNFEYKFI